MIIEANVIQIAEQFVKEHLENDRSGHDWWHIDRVRKLALEIARTEQADPFICELAALLHDVADEKLNASKEAGLDKVKCFLHANVKDEAVIAHVMSIISTMSFNGGKNPSMQTAEGRIVQDADRLDAIGAIGIARTFAYAGSKGHYMHDPAFVPNGEYRRNDNTAVNHFYEKLFKLKDLMNTERGKQLAGARHRLMEQFLEQFLKEWEVKHEAESI